MILPDKPKGIRKYGFTKKEAEAYYKAMEKPYSSFTYEQREWFDKKTKQLAEAMPGLDEVDAEERIAIKKYNS